MSVKLLPCNLLRKDITVSSTENTAVSKNEQEERKLKETIEGIDTLQKFKNKLMLRDIASMSHRMQNILDRAAAKRSYSNFMLTPSEMRQMEAEDRKGKQRWRSKSAPCGKDVNNYKKSLSKKVKRRNAIENLNEETPKAAIQTSVKSYIDSNNKRDKRASITSDLMTQRRNVRSKSLRRDSDESWMTSENFLEHHLEQEKDFDNFHKVRIDSWLESTVTEDDDFDSVTTKDDEVVEFHGPKENTSKDVVEVATVRRNSVGSISESASETADSTAESGDQRDLIQLQRYAKLRRRSSLAENLKKFRKDFLNKIDEEVCHAVKTPDDELNRLQEPLKYESREERETTLNNMLKKERENCAENMHQVSKLTAAATVKTKACDDKQKASEINKKNLITLGINQFMDKSLIKNNLNNDASTLLNGTVSKPKITVTSPKEPRPKMNKRQEKICRRLMYGEPTGDNNETTRKIRANNKQEPSHLAVPENKLIKEDKIVLKRITIMRDLLNPMRDGVICDGWTSTTNDSHGNKIRLQRRNTLTTEDDTLPAMWEVQRNIIAQEGNKALDVLSMKSEDSERCDETDIYETLKKCKYLRLPKYMTDKIDNEFF